MPTFRFHHTWTVAAPPAAVHAVLDDLERYPQWWRQVVAVVKVDDDTARVLCRSTLPYTLDLVLHAVRRERALMEVELAGDLTGTARFVLEDAGAGTHVDFQQEVAVASRGLALAARAFPLLLRWNHDRMMAGCRDGLARATVSRG